MTVMSDDDSVATITCGDWGDKWPAIRLITGYGMNDTAAEAYMEKTVYGSVPVEQAEANARLIAAAPDLLDALRECRTDLIIGANNADHAAKTDPRWEGVGDRLRYRASKADAAIAKATGGQS
jgi:hypothetical protein